MLFTQRAFRAMLLPLALMSFGGMLLMPAAQPRALAVPPAKLSSNLNDYIVPKLDDFDTTMVATFHDDNAARKINRDIGMMYQLKGNVRVRYKEENKFRADGQLGAGKGSLVINDTKQVFSLGGLGKVKSELGKTPGKRKSLLDMGLISEAYLTYAQGEFIGERPFEGTQCAVFKITYKDRSQDSSHRIVWIDPRTKITLKREEYAQDISGGKLRSIWLYRDPKEVSPGIWFPSRIELFNNENEKAGVTTYTNTHVNVGLSDDVFRL